MTGKPRQGRGDAERVSPFSPLEANVDEITEGVFWTDARSGLAGLPEGSVDAIITSPPYWKQRSYGTEPLDWPELNFTPMRGLPGVVIPAWHGELGQEDSPGTFVAHLIYALVPGLAALKPGGNLLVNLGDKYVDKELQGTPQRLALGLQALELFWRQDIIWAKNATKPEKVRDRCTRSHEVVLHFTLKGSGYYWDAEAISQRVDDADPDGRPQRRRARELWKQAGLTDDHLRALRACGLSDVGKSRATQTGTGRNRPEVEALAAEARAALGGYAREMLTGDWVNRRSVWTPEGNLYAGAHSAVMPWGLAADLVLASCPPEGVVVDPFAGSGTVLQAAVAQGRRAVGFDAAERAVKEAERNMRSAPQGLGLI